MTNTLNPGHRPAPRRSARFLLLGLILLAFARLTWQLDAKDLWLDETFSLQRAEAAWPELIAGCLPLTDGVTWVKTTDQHPFAYFIFLGLAARMLGQSEFALRFPAVIAATLVAPVIWALGRRLGRNKSVPPTTPLWAVLLAAISPFYLWFGQEVRMYAQVGLLALLSAYLLLRWAEGAATAGAAGRRWLAGYGLTLFLLLTSHYFGLLVLPVHAAIVFGALRRRQRVLALLATVGLIALALAPGSFALWLLTRDEVAGTNWARITPHVLLPDLVNAFSLGLSVDLGQVWPLDVLFAALALLGALYGLAQRRSWTLPALLIVPPVLLLFINAVRPAYMTARHMSLVSAFFIVLVAAGLAWIWQARQWAAMLLAAILIAASGYSTVRYFTLSEYSKGEHAAMGRYLTERVQEGDLVLFRPLPWGRLFRYYFPADAIGQAELAGHRVSWRVLPTDFPENAPPAATVSSPAVPAAQRTAVTGAFERLVRGLFGTRGWYECPLPPSPVVGRPAELARPLFTSSRTALIGELDALATHYRRIWLVRADGDDPVSEWLRTRSFHADGRAFASPLTSLRIDLFLTESPVRTQPPIGIEHAVDIVFGDQVRLVGYDLGRPFMAGGAWPVTLYWQPVAPLTRRYKYILGSAAVETLQATSLQPRQPTETEPYNGFLSTPLWPVGATIVEYTGVQRAADVDAHPAPLMLQVYDAETLQKLPVVRAAGASATPDPFTVVLSGAP